MMNFNIISDIKIEGLKVIITLIIIKRIYEMNAVAYFLFFYTLMINVYL